MFIVDAHEDIAFNALQHGRDVRRSVLETRLQEREHPLQLMGPLSGMAEEAMLGIPEHRQGGVGLIFATIFVPPGTPGAMTADGLAQLAYYHDLSGQGIGVRLVTSRAELQTLRHDWDAASTPATRPVGLVLLLEGADPLAMPSNLAEWRQRGLRIVGPAWRATRYAGGTGVPGPLTPNGHALLAEMERLGVMLDISHLAEESFWQALAGFGGAVLASHSNCRAFVPTDRHLSDEMIRAIVARDGVIGTVLANQFLIAGWTYAAGPVTLEAVVRHIDHICQLAGSARHSAVGSDFDGGFGVQSTPVAFDSIADLGGLADALTQRGYSADDVEGILGGNWLRLLARALPA
jgi:membrane dipeptidase